MKEFRVYICEGFAYELIEYSKISKEEGEYNKFYDILRQYSSREMCSTPFDDFIIASDNSNTGNCDDLDEINDKCKVTDFHYIIFGNVENKARIKTGSYTIYDINSSHNFINQYNIYSTSSLVSDNDILMFLKALGKVQFANLAAPYLIQSISKQNSRASCLIKYLTQLLNNLPLTFYDTNINDAKIKDISPFMGSNILFYCFESKGSFMDRILFTESILINFNHSLDSNADKTADPELTSILKIGNMRTANKIVREFNHRKKNNLITKLR